MKIHFHERDSRKNHPDFKMTMGSFSVICSILEKGLRELDCYVDNIEEADYVGIADSLATDFRIDGKKCFGIYFVDCINTIPNITLERLKHNPELKLFSINEHTSELFKQYGFDCKVLGPGIDSDFWTPEGEKYNKFTFIHSGFSNIRSGLDQLLPAFYRAFKGNDNVRLIIKNTSDSSILEQQIKEYQKDCNIVYINKRIDFIEMRSLYRASHVLCSVFRHSGHGLPIGEAACVGCLPLIGYFSPSKEIAISPKFAFALEPEKEVEINKIKPELINHWGLTDTFGGLEFLEEPLVYSYNIEEYAQTLQELYIAYNQHWAKKDIRGEALKVWDYKNSAIKLIDGLQI